jgi:hypothetical protein
MLLFRLLDVYAAMRNEEQVLHSLDEILESKINKNKERPRASRQPCFNAIIKQREERITMKIVC